MFVGGDLDTGSNLGGRDTEGAGINSSAVAEALSEATTTPTAEREKLIALLENGQIEAFNRLRTQGRLDLSGVDLRGKDLSGVNFQDVNLSDALLDGAILRGPSTNLRNAVLRGASLLERADLSDADLSGAVLDGADCRETNFSGAKLEAVSAERALFMRANLTNVSAAHAQFRLAQMAEADLTGGNFSEAWFSYADLTGVHAEVHGGAAKANFSKAHFENSHLTRGSFEGAIFESANMHGVHVEEANFTNAAMTGAILSKAAGAQAIFKGADLREAIFDNADLAGVIFNEADLTKIHAFRASFEGGQFKRVVAEEANFEGSLLEQANLDGGWFLKAAFRQARLINTSAKEANFMQAFFELGLVEETTFTGSDMRHAKFILTSLNNTVFDGVNAQDAVFSQAQGINVSFRDANLVDVNMRLAALPDAVFDGAYVGPKGFTLKDSLGSSENIFAKVRWEVPAPGTFKEISHPRAGKTAADGSTTPAKVALSSSIKPENRADYDAAMQELNDLVGLADVKRAVSDIAAFVQLNNARVAMGLKPNPRNLQFVFMGNPGTGKTVVARLLGRIFKGLGYLQKGHTVERDRKGLVGGYVGQTEEKTGKALDEALDGILVVDEAYALASGGENDYGPRAIEAILKFMEDNRGRIVMVVCGYSDKMREFIESNPGLKSRFKEYITFPDYSASELAEIFRRDAVKLSYEMDGFTRAGPLVLAHFMKLRADDNFGNARDMRNAFEDTTNLMSRRLNTQGVVTRKDLTTFTMEDFPFEDLMGVPKHAIPWQDLRWELKDENGKVVREVTCAELGTTIIDPHTKHDIAVGFPEPTAETAQILRDLVARYPFTPKHERR